MLNQDAKMIETFPNVNMNIFRIQTRVQATFGFEIASCQAIKILVLRNS